MAAGIKKVGLYGTTSYDMVPAGMGFGSTGIGYYTVSMVEGLRNAGYTVDKEFAEPLQEAYGRRAETAFPSRKTGRLSRSLRCPVPKSSCPLPRNWPRK